MTFTEKVRYKMLRDHRSLLVAFADKVAVREYVESVVGQGFLPAVHAQFDRPSDLASAALPDEFVVKPTHGSGAVVVVSRRARSAARLPEPPDSWCYAHVLPEHAGGQRLADIAAHWVAQLYGQGPNREWAYGSVPRRILVEELLTGTDGDVADDYKLFVFHGRCRFVQVDSGRFGHRTQDFYRTPWEWLPLSGGPPHASPPKAEPEQLTDMIAIAERLGAPTDFVRVDLYAVRDRIVVGELTSYPAGGDSPFHPPSFDVEFGSHWTVPDAYRDRS